MRTEIIKITALTVIMCFSASAGAFTVESVNIIPEGPLEADIITFDILGWASSAPSWVDHDLFTQDGTSLQLDLYVNRGICGMISEWTYEKQIGTLSADTYILEVRAYDNYLNTLEDTYTVEFTVVPEPATLALLSFGFMIVRARSRRP